VQQGRRLGPGREDLELLQPGGIHREGDLAFLELPGRVMIDDEHVLQRRQLVEDLAHLGDVLALGDDDGRAGVVQAHEERFVPKGREERLGNRPDLEDAQQADVQLGNAVQEQADPVARLDAQPAQESAEPVAAGPDILEGVAFCLPGGVFPKQGGFLALAQLTDAVRAIPADVEAVASLVTEFLFRDRPIEAPEPFLVTTDIEHNRFPFLGFTFPG
jgi:hypothetical protein